MISRFYSLKLMEDFEKQLNLFLKDTAPIPEQYHKLDAELIKIRKIYKELIIINTTCNKNGATSSLRLIKTQYMDDIENPQVSINPNNYQKLYKLKIAVESLEDEMETFEGDSVEREAMKDFVPIKLIMNKEESLFVLYNRQLIVAGRFPYEKSESTIEVRIVGKAFAKGSGREVLKVEFHPLNGNYIGVLTTRGMFSLYNLTSDLDKPEQEFELLKKYGEDVRLEGKKIVSSFCFGSKQNYSWTTFSVFFLLTNGEVYSLCPIIPGSILIEPIFIDVLSEIVQREQSNNTKLQSLKREFISLLKEGEPSEINEHYIILDIDKLNELKPIGQGPAKIYKNTATDTIQKNFIDLISFDCFPYVYLVTTNKGTIDVVISWTDSNPAFKSNARVGMGLNEFKTVPSNLLWIVFNQISLTPETTPTLYWNTKDPFIFYAGVGGNLCQITNSWLFEMQKLCIESPLRMDKEFVKKLEGSQVTVVAKGDTKYGCYLGAETIDDYLILTQATSKFLQARIFNIYNAIVPNDLERKVKKADMKPEIGRFGGKSKFKPIDYKGLTGIEPFLLKEEEKTVEPLDVLEYLQKTLPGYFSLVKRDAERKVLQEDIAIVKKHEENVGKLLNDLDSKIKALENNKSEVKKLVNEVEGMNVLLRTIFLGAVEGED